MTPTAQVAVAIPTYNRDLRVFKVLERIEECNPCPIDILVHIDRVDGQLESELARQFPSVRVLTSPTRSGPGGGRHRCLSVCNAPYAVSFDDDSYPVDADFFGRVEELFLQYPNAAVFGASIWHRWESERKRVESVCLAPTYIGCGFAIRLAAYRKTRGFLSRQIAYGMEEADLSVQLFAAGWNVYEVGDLRVFHDTDLKHHESSEINAGVITNTGLFVFLHFPAVCWGWGLLKVANRVAFCLRVGRFRGVCSGLLQIPIECYRHRRYRNAISWRTLRRFLAFCQTGNQFG